MIVKNEEPTLARILACAQTFCDEMIVVDTGSTDRTVEIAKEMGAQVFHFEWIDDFAAARNYSLQQCTSDWIIWLDADDYIPEACQEKLKILKQTDLEQESLNAVLIPYHITFDEAGNCNLNLRRERLLRRKAGFKWEHPLHEVIYVTGEKKIRDDIWIEHRAISKHKNSTQRNILLLAKAMQRDENLNNPRMLYIAGRELLVQQMYDEALSYFYRFREVSPAAQRWQAYDVCLKIALCHKKLNQLDDSREALLKALSIDSRRAEAFNELGLLAYEKSDWMQALPYFRAAAASEIPADEEMIMTAHYTWVPYEYLSRCHGALGDYPKAVEIALKALPAHPQKANFLETIRWYINQYAKTPGGPA